MRVLTYNILDGGVGREALVTSVFQHAQPDVAILQEVIPNGLVERLAESSSMQSAVVAGNSSRHMALLSRWPIIATTSHHPYPPVRHVILDASVHTPIGPLHVFGVHTLPVYGIARELWRAWEVRTMLRYVRPVADQPCLVMGDFNAAAPGDCVRFETKSIAGSMGFWLNGAGRLRLAVRQMRSAGFVDCYRLLHPESPGYTLPPPDPGVRLDYIFANLLLKSRLRRCEVVREPVAADEASDHYPVMAEFDLPS